VVVKLAVADVQEGGHQTPSRLLLVLCNNRPTALDSGCLPRTREGGRGPDETLLSSETMPALLKALVASLVMQTCSAKRTGGGGGCPEVC
jgi:hypothetical protein